MAYRNTYANNYVSVNSNPYITRSDISIADLVRGAMDNTYNQMQENKRSGLRAAIEAQGNDERYGLGAMGIGASAYPQLEQQYNALQDLYTQKGDTEGAKAAAQQAENARQAYRTMLQNGIFRSQFGQPSLGTYNPSMPVQGALRPGQTRQFTQPSYAPPTLKDYQDYINRIWNTNSQSPDNYDAWGYGQ